MVTKLLKLVALAVALYYGYTVGLPWARETLASFNRPAGAVRDEQSVTCVLAAERANRGFVDEVTAAAKPPVDKRIWSTALVSVSTQLSEADATCDCPTLACERAQEALADIRGLLGQFDQWVHGESESIGNPATLQEKINRQLREARALAGS